MTMVESKSILQACLGNISHQSNLMKQSLQDNNILQALKHCSNFLSELRTSQLPPKQYYEMYMVVFDSLEILSSHLLASYKSKLEKKPQSAFLSDLYELVQYSGNIIPRLYMMIVVGTTFMSTNDAPKKELMKDMIEMCCGVQHPIRGLFLRYYLSQRIKDLLPISTKQDLDETVEFLVTNFIEMNKLWVRLQHQGHSSERELRYKERMELKILVGSNLVRLSQIIDDYSGDDSYEPVEYYQKKIFPVITEQIIQCRDRLAQSYLIDVIIQIFPVTFHFATLNELLNDVFIKLMPNSKKSELILTLVDRFINYHNFEYIPLDEEIKELKVDDNSANSNMQQNDTEVNEEFKQNDHQTENENGSDVESKDISIKEKSGSFSVKKSFDIFWKFYFKLIEYNSGLPAEEHSLILQAFIKLTLTYDPDNYNNLEQIYEYAAQNLMHKTNDDSENVKNGSQMITDEKIWLSLLMVPIEYFSSIKNLLNLNHFYNFFASLTDVKHQKQISLQIIDKIIIGGIQHGTNFASNEEIDNVFKFLNVIIQDSGKDINTSEDLGIVKSFSIDNGSRSVTREFLNIQEKISKVLHFVHHSDPYKTLGLLNYVRKKYLNKNPQNIIFTYPTLISLLMNNLKKSANFKVRNSSDENLDLLIASNFKNLSLTIDELYQHHQQYNSEIILNIYLNAASLADQLKMETIAYEFFTQCFIVYEENLILNSAKISNHNSHSSIGGSIPYQSVIAIANKLSNSRYFTKDNYEALITKVTLYGSKLLKKQDQCRSVYYCAHLWWWVEFFISEPSPTLKGNSSDDLKNGLEDKTSKNGEIGENEEQEEDQENQLLYRDSKRVLECLQKSLRVADSCMDPYLSLKLFIEILNRCLIFYIYGNELIDTHYVNGLIDLIKTNIDNLKNDNDDDNDIFINIKLFFQRTLDYIENEKVLGNRFQDIVT